MQWSVENVLYFMCIYRNMMMTACDVAAITKPWKVQMRVDLQLLAS